ncbi:sporulation protein YjcZ [Paenibacillus albicereus]|uniref:Sporulation protein YjcZ n=1 Tax=Paenibacillus albicereus TaxID=2726185 RepID=A0A6H2GWE9_9BACL|nr:sporulation protein YjcZ [Paenibacillus albicereus]QJC51751.1 sporulation protein YjcZ [Paenibacillus albicereus]
MGYAVEGVGAGYGAYGCGGLGTTTGVILVLFILLVIITRAFFI